MQIVTKQVEEYTAYTNVLCGCCTFDDIYVYVSHRLIRLLLIS
jgi:hypothetical protein